MAKRREWGTGSLYQRKSDGRWIGAVDVGYKPDGITRDRRTVSGKTRDEARRKLRDLQLAVDKGEQHGRTTVKEWADIYLVERAKDLRPKAYNAAASPIRKWVVPTIGRRRLAELTPADIRAVDNAQRKAGRQPNDTRRVMMTMLRAALVEGHHVPPPVFAMRNLPTPPSDRQAMTVDEGLRMLKAAAELPHGSRWLITLVYGQRKGEALGLTWPAIDFDAAGYGEFDVEWQLQTLPYNVRYDRSSGFRVPDNHVSVHLVDAYHLVRPKTSAGFRVAPLLKPLRKGLLAWQKNAPAAVRENPWGLVWPGLDGKPVRAHDDDDEWHKLQKAAGVGHPAGRPYYVHECRNFAITMMMEAGVPEHIIIALVGHSSILQSRKYTTVRREPILEAMERVGERLQLG